ncbi:MAG: glycine zipper domain-containing protein [Robiginitomaculum sp.]
MKTLRNTSISTLAIFSALSASLTLAACSTTGDMERDAAIGAGVGAVAGAVIGNNVGDGDATAGAAIGAVVGGASGAYHGYKKDETHSGPQAQQMYVDEQVGRSFYVDESTGNTYWENGDFRS